MIGRPQNEDYKAKFHCKKIVDFSSLRQNCCLVAELELISILPLKCGIMSFTEASKNILVGWGAVFPITRLSCGPSLWEDIPM